MVYEKRPVNIEGYEHYQCDTNGIIYGRNGKALTPITNSKTGYQQVNLCKDGKYKTFRICKIVSLTFFDEYNPKKYRVAYINDKSKDNNFENLKLVKKYHYHYHYNYKKTGKRAQGKSFIKGIDIKTGDLKYLFSNAKKASDFFAKSDEKVGNVQSVFSRALSGKLNSYKKCKWEYVTDNKKQNQNIALVEIIPDEIGNYAVIYDSSKDYRYMVFCSVRNKRKAVDLLRKCGVMCPHSAYRAS